MAGSATCSGEGGMIPDERRYSEKWYYQCIQSRYFIGTKMMSGKDF